VSALSGLDLVSGFAFFVEVAAVGVVYDRNGEVLHLQTAKGSKQALLKILTKQGIIAGAKK